MPTMRACARETQFCCVMFTACKLASYAC